MDRRSAERNVVIVKRKKVIAGGHHGGAWKVAYADFVTAMMAFFLLMWLLSVTTEEQRMGLADYFSPSIPLYKTGGGGDGPFGGTSMFSQTTMSQDETGRDSDELLETDMAADSDQTFWDIEQELMAGSGDAVEADPLLKHIRTRITDEGLIIEVFDIEGSPLFDGQSSQPNPVLQQLLDMVGRVLAQTTNPVAVTGHLDARPEGEGPMDPWRLSSDRAQVARALLVQAGVVEPRLARVTGKADRSPAVEDPADSRNRRVEITLLRRFEP